MSKEERSFEEDIKINKFKLDVECEKHPSIFWYWTNKLAQYKNNLLDTEDSLKLITAEVDTNYRENWDETNWGKKTEGSISGKVAADEKVRKAKENYMKCQHEVNILNASVSAMEHKKAMLDNEIKLLIGGFYSAPNAGKSNASVEKGGRVIRDKLNKRK
ncbi:MAG: hypothetical protein PHF86_08475 [Candidatus Nanoarchaeia archaeon]|jgi:hypothetical protein|nr:hypothetical protein [Candidatus Nanoarchaeia archaeon]